MVTLLVGAAQASYYEQAASANLGLPMASSVNVGQGYEHKRFKPPSLANMYVTTNYIEEIDTPASKAFLEKFKAKFPDEPYINQEAANSYIAMNLYKQLVERANGSTNREDLRKVLAQGDVCFDGPSGKVCLDPKSQHMSHTIYLARVTEDHKIEFPKVWDDIKPYWLGDAGCDLTKTDPERAVHAVEPPAEALSGSSTRGGRLGRPPSALPLVGQLNGNMALRGGVFPVHNNGQGAWPTIGPVPAGGMDGWNF